MLLRASMPVMGDLLGACLVLLLYLPPGESATRKFADPLILDDFTNISGSKILFIVKYDNEDGAAPGV